MEIAAEVVRSLLLILAGCVIGATAAHLLRRKP
jgi:hypothetical protein